MTNWHCSRYAKVVWTSTLRQDSPTGALLPIGLKNQRKKKFKRFILNISKLMMKKHMDISIIQQQAIQSIVDYTAADKLNTLRLSAYCDLENLSHVLGSRTLTAEEMTTFQYCIEIIIRLDPSRYGVSASFREKRRAKLTAYYSNHDRSKSRGYKVK